MNRIHLESRNFKVELEVLDRDPIFGYEATGGSPLKDFDIYGNNLLNGLFNGEGFETFFKKHMEVTLIKLYVDGNLIVQYKNPFDPKELKEEIYKIISEWRKTNDLTNQE